MYRGTRIAYLHLLSSERAFGVIGIGANASEQNWFDITWDYSPGASYEIHWSDGLLSWSSVVPDPGDMTVDEEAGTATWTDKGTSAGMGGIPPGQAPQRYYRIELLSP
jgi:hypothetical protein